ncbi:MAG TPA: MEDS domain-containing protein, partial [Actinopolymorphaceae bacterium]
MEDSTRAHGEIEAIPSGPALPARHGRLGLARVDRGGRIDRIGDTRRRTTGTGTVPVGRMTPGDHFCFVYDTDAEADAVVTTFLLDGVRTGQKVLYLSDRREPADDPVAVGHEELVAAREEGQLDVLTGGDRPALDAGLRRAARDGDTAVRITSAPGTEAARTWSEEY